MTNRVKRIVIIGGMGPQASVHAHKRLTDELSRMGKLAEIVHLSLVIEPFFDNKPKLVLTKRQIDLLSNIDADIGFVACNTAHLFIEEIRELVGFELVSMLEFERRENMVMVCSPTSKDSFIFGDDAHHLDNELNILCGEIIQCVNAGMLVRAEQKFNRLLSELPLNTEPLFCCTELSMLADQFGVESDCTLKTVINKIVERV